MNTKNNKRPDAEPSLAEKVAFLLSWQAYGSDVGEIVAHETHMSWVFLVGDRAYKLKKPVCFPYLDFSTLEKREAACRAELSLNRRLAPHVYLDVVPLTLRPTGLSIGNGGLTVDWLVVMRRLDEIFMLDRMISDQRVSDDDVERLSGALTAFYRKAPKRKPSAMAYLSAWQNQLSGNRAILFRSRFDLPKGPLFRIDRAQRRFLTECRALLLSRVTNGAFIEGHGDLRPEHIWFGHPFAVIDCLEFNARLRAVDPIDEAAYFAIECERLGVPWVGQQVQAALAKLFLNNAPPELVVFYRCFRASLRARLMLAHLLEPNPRTPEKWFPLACHYLTIAEREARLLERLL